MNRIKNTLWAMITVVLTALLAACDSDNGDDGTDDPSGETQLINLGPILS